MTRRLFLLVLLLGAWPISAQERPIAVSTLTTTNTGATSICVGCAVGSSTATGTIKAGVLDIATIASHAISAGGTGSQLLRIRNTSAGTANTAEVWMGNDTSATAGVLMVGSSTYTTIAAYGTDFAALRGLDAGGLVVAAEHASGIIDFYTAGNGTGNRRFSVNAAGDLTIGTSRKIMDSNGTPGITSGFGTSPAIAGNDYAFAVTFGSGAGVTGGVVTFGHTFTTGPVCSATMDGTLITSSDETTTTITIAVASATYTGKRVKIHCRGY